MGIIRGYWLLLGVFLLISCGKEQAKLNNDLVTSYDGKTTHGSCKGLNLTENLLTQQTMLKIFDCIGWTKEFPHIHSYIKSLNNSEIKLVFEPANKFLFGTKVKRDDFLGFIQKNIEKKEVDVISQKLQKIIKNKSLTKSLLKIFEKSKFNLPSKSFLDDAVKMMNVFSKNSLDERRLVSEGIIKIKKSSKDQFYKKFILSLYDNVFDRKSGFISDTILFLQPTSWPVQFINNYTTNEIRELIEFKYLNSDLGESLNGIEQSIRLNLNNCSDFNNIYFLDYQKELDEQLRALAESTRSSFLMDVLDLSEKFSLFNNICPYSDFNRNSANVLSYLRTYVLLPGGHEFLKAMAKVSVDTEDKYFIFNMIKSETFDQLSKLFVEDKKQKTAIVENLHLWLLKINENEVKSLLDFLIILNKEIKEEGWLAFSNLEEEEKLELVDFFVHSGLLDENLFQESLLLEKILNKYGELYTSYYNVFSNNKIEKTFFLFKLNKYLNNESFRKELIHFVDKDVFFKLISFISQNTPDEKVDAEKKKEEETSLPRVILTLDSEEEQLLSCVAKYNEIAKLNFDFWTILDSYPKECMTLLSNKTMASYIFQWTIQIDNTFERLEAGRFSYPYGMISPEMMRFYHSLMHIINTHLHRTENYITVTVENIKKELFEYGLMGVIDESVSLLDYLGQKSNLIELAVKDISLVKPEIFDRKVKNILSFFEQDANLKSFPKYSCDEINNTTGAIACPSEDEIFNLLIELKELLYRDNGAPYKLYERLVDFIFAKDGILIPFDEKKQRSKSFSLEEVVRFLFDMSNPKTKKEINFYSKNNSFKTYADRAQRLEIVIREISFLNNFYGAFFMNSVSGAKKYYKKVKAMRKNVIMMEKTGGFFRRRSLFPEKTAWAFKNILETYSSLYELDRVHKQPDGKSYRYGDFIQAFLTMVVETSSFESQKYTPFQTPKVELVEKHNGMFVTHLVEFGFLSHLGAWLRSISNNNVINIISDKKFKVVNRSLERLVSPRRLKRFMKFALSHKNINYILKDFSKFSSNIKEKDKNILLNLIKDTSYILVTGLDSYGFDKMLPVLEVVLDNYHNLRKTDLFEYDSDFFSLLTSYINRVSSLKEEEIKDIVQPLSLFTSYIKKKEIDASLRDKKFIDNLSKLKDALKLYDKGPVSNSGFMKAFLSDEDLSFEELHHTFVTIYVKNKKVDYFNNLIKVLAKKDKQTHESNAYYALKEIFVEKEDVVIKFLSDTFSKFYRPSHQ